MPPIAQDRFRLTVEQTPSAAEVAIVRRGLLAFNRAARPHDDYRELAIFIRDGDGAVIGGLVGESFFDWLFVSMLWLPADLRQAGLGGRLLRQAEEEAARRSCVGVFLDTFSFQARGFYEKQGYAVFGTLPDSPRGDRRFWLMKRLADAGAA